ncbi:hypothetical protein BWI17_00180 [Betaproteobacteria bacterium GR16-43]|nr:hypothetical protein BWI17_00180 [Betaproteobacteria bacterium GR16-43]
MISNINDRVLRAIAMARIPGFHFSGHFLDVAFGNVAPEGAHVSMEIGPHLVGTNGSAHPGAIAFLADIALSASIRSTIDESVRLATVHLHLQLTGAPAIGRLDAIGEFQGNFVEAAARHGLSRTTLTCNGKKVAIGTGAFMMLEPPPGVTMHPVRQERSHAPPLKLKDLTPHERAILRAADKAEAQADSHASFIERFWGYEAKRTATGATCAMRNGGQVGNRVGHVQGGILIGLAAATANASLPETWRLSAINTSFVSPGEGSVLRARSKVVHHGRKTAVVHTEVTGVSRRRVLDVVSTHVITK